MKRFGDYAAAPTIAALSSRTGREQGGDGRDCKYISYRFHSSFHKMDDKNGIFAYLIIRALS